MKKWLPKILVGLVLLPASAFLLKGDVWTFWTWWLLALLMGMIGMPVTGKLFARFRDKGWMFSKVLSIAFTGFLTWFLVAVGILKFTVWTCVGVVFVCAVGSFFLFRYQLEAGEEVFPSKQISLIVWEELLFFGMFLLWTYLAGFHPAAYGTEKFMDYGFMEAMMRSTSLPATDLWYSQGHINYYYGGQYFAVFLTKLSGSRVELTYHLMRTFVAGLAFVLPFSLVFQMTADRLEFRNRTKGEMFPVLSGLLAGGAVSLAGNMHYIVYGKILPMIQKIQGKQEVDSYWFPNATRYIGFDPDVPDKTIHEFPSYSFVLGDLHAHVVNLMFVLLLIGILYAWLQQTKDKKEILQNLGKKQFWLREMGMPHLIVISILLGMFQWTNFWDFVIYFVVTGGVALFGNVIRFRGKVKTIAAVTGVQAVEVLGISYVVILPFTLRFETMVQGIALAKNHSLLHQLLVLWGLPVCLTLVFIFVVFWEKMRHAEIKTPWKVLKAIKTPDLFGVILGLCAMGLVLIPELVYVRDIYEKSNARANTMFKLTYQAYLMFGILMGYAIFRIFVLCRGKTVKIIAGAGLICLLGTFGYFGNSVSAWFGPVWNPEKYQGLDATAFLEKSFPEDAAGIRWLKKNIKGSPVVLEANGDSYSDYERVSAMTGLPTILGWYVHEWLWRSDVADLNEKSADVETIYTSQDETQVKELLEKYRVSYIFVGAKEREKYGERLNETLLRSLGEVVFQDSNFATYIINVTQ